MRPKLALVHTSPTLTPLFTQLAAKWLPEVDVVHLVDETLIKNTIAAGRLQKLTMRRTIALIGSAVESGADAVLVTCSSIGPGIDMAAALYDTPVLRVDRPMAEAAVAQGRRIGVVATLPTTLKPTRELVQSSADLAGREVELVDCLCSGAFEALMSGDGATHDRIVGEALTTRLQNVDVIVLAQASIARVIEGLPPGALKAPVLASPELGVRRVRQVLFGDRPPSLDKAAEEQAA
jgi:Asp/Glu/hydantoin racemase